MENTLGISFRVFRLNPQDREPTITVSRRRPVYMKSDLERFTFHGHDPVPVDRVRKDPMSVKISMHR